MKHLYALTALFLCLACAAHAASPPKVTLFTPTRPGMHPFWGAFTDFARAAAADLGIDLTVVYSKHRFAVVEDARKMIARGETPDYAVYIYQAKNSLDMLNMLETAGINSLICNTDVTEADRNLAGRPRDKFRHWIGHLYPDDLKAGRDLANRLIERGFELGLTDNDGVLHLAGVGGARDTTSGTYRKKGLEEAIKYAPKVVLDRFVWADWERDKAKAKAEHLLDMYPDAGVFWTVNNCSALGVLDAAREKGFSPRMNLLTGGIDWTEEGIQAVRDGLMEAAVGGHFMDGAWALVMIYDHYNGHDFAAPEPTVHSEMRLIDQDNVETYLPLFNRANWKKIDFKRFTKTHTRDLKKYEFNPDAVLRQLTGN